MTGELQEVDIDFDSLPDRATDTIPEGAESFAHNQFHVYARPPESFWSQTRHLERGDVVGVHWQTGFIGEIAVAMQQEDIASVDTNGTFGQYRYEAFRDGDHLVHITRDQSGGNWPDIVVWIERDE